MLKKYILPALLISLILSVNVLRFVGLGDVPDGFQIDELTAGVTLSCMAQEGASPLGDTHYPLFGENSFATPSPPTYMYPGMLWVKAFGFSQGALRGFTAFAVVIGLLGLFAIGYYLAGLRCGLWILLAASLSPWIWSISRVSWESLLMLPFLIWGLFFCLKAKRSWHFILAGMLLSGAAYSYPTARLQVPLFILIMTCYGLIWRQWRIRHLVALAAAFLLTSTPLVWFYLTHPSLSARFKEVAITNPEHLRDIGSSGTMLELFKIVIQNFIAHLHPDYLFFKGTPKNLTLSTGHQGMLSWIDVTALVAGLGWMALRFIQRKPAAATATLLFLGFLGINIIIGIFPATLVWIENPHPLRSIGAWPFAMLATGIILHKTTEKWPWSGLLALALAGAFACVFLRQYFYDYAKDSRGWFSVWTREEASHAKTDQAWMNFLYRYHYHMLLSRYYLMRYHGDNCTQARLIWEKLYPVFSKIAKEAKNQP